MKQVGQLIEADGRYEFRIDEKGLIIRGDHPEWVMKAAGEVLETTEKLEAESRIDELESLVEFEAATSIEVDSARYAMKERFETIPQCIVTMGKMDYRWAAKEGRDKLHHEFDGHAVKRINDMSLTFNDSFLANETGVDTSSTD
ncbi:hypothetical protein HKCCE3408_06145 [Rhodobacterales bacterium HKCCE3408]|nr:hypothetical protein [Rhodobacterales bacterium HKCCE3408]